MPVLFSIIVPIYKVESYLTQCLDSILNQEFGNFELILVDDGSPDRSPEICDEYQQKDNRVKVIHKKNGGLVEARKSGSEVASGEYIICVDGDDYIEHSFLREANEIIEKWNPDIICCNYYRGQEEMPKFIIPTGYYDKVQIKDIIFPSLIEDQTGRYFRPQIWAKVYRSSIYKSQQKSVSGEISIGEDHACTKPCIFNADSLFILDTPLYHYRINAGSMTNAAKAFSWEGPEAIGKHFEKQIDMAQFDFQDQVYRSVAHNLFNVAVSQFNRKESFQSIKKDILEHLNSPYYHDAIMNCKYEKKANGNLARIALKYRLVWLMYLYHRMGK